MDAITPRRSFLKALLAVSGALAVSGWPRAAAAGAGAGRDRLGERLPERALGRTGEGITVLGLGGSHVIMQDYSEAKSQALIEAALEQGIRFFDTAQQYGDGLSERRYGKFLTPKYRDLSYVMTKTEATEKTQALRDMDECRQRLGVDVIDLMQIHHIDSAADVDKRVDGGVVDVLLEAREQGKIRHLGFTGHKSPSAHLRMFERLDALGVAFDAVQMPVNLVDPGYESFIEHVLPACLQRGCGVLAMKTLAHGQMAGVRSTWGNPDRVPQNLVPQRVSLDEALGFVWSLPVASLISGMNEVAMVRENAALARAFAPLDDERRLALVEACADAAGPLTEFYKKA